MLTIPADLKVYIVGGLTFLLTNGLKALVGTWGGTIEGWGTAIVAASVAAIMLFLDAIVGLIPVEYHSLAGSVFGLAVAILGAMGVHFTIKNY